MQSFSSVFVHVSLLFPPTLLFVFYVRLRSVLKPQQGVEGQGLLYRKGESVVLDMDGTSCVAVVTQFLCIAIDGQFQQFVEGRLIDKCLDCDDEHLEFEDTGYFLLQADSRQRIVLPATSVMRKTITCPNPSNPLQLVAIDFQRKSMPLLNEDVIVPFFPVEGDMVLINGTDPEPWVGKVVRAHVTPRDQMARVCYYTKTRRKEYSGELFDILKTGRNFDYVSWNSILGLAAGEWHGCSWKMPIPSQL